MDVEIITDKIITDKIIIDKIIIDKIIIDKIITDHVSLFTRKVRCCYNIHFHLFLLMVLL